jgi:CheY-like chemotaxis protein
VRSALHVGRLPGGDRIGLEHPPRLDRTALVIDDDKFVASALAELLEDDGFDVHTATNGFSAFRQALELRPALVLLDLALPERSGTQLLEDLRADPTTRDIAIVVVSGYAESLSDTAVADTDGVISKPFDAHNLLDIIHRAIQRAAARRAEVAPAVVGVGHRESGLRARRPTSARVPRHGR